MLLTPNLIKTLDLSPKDIRILNTLDSGSTFLISDISKYSKIPRMTLYPILDNLKDRNLIDYKRSGKRKYWYLESHNKIASKLSHISSTIGSEKIEVKKEDSGFIIHRNIKSIYSIFEEVANLSQGERVKAIQPTKSVMSVMNNLKWQEEIKPINEAIVKKGIVVEGLIQDNYYTALYNRAYKDSPEKAKEWIESFVGRATDITFIDKRYLDTDSEFLMFRNKAFIINWRDEVAIEIKNKDMFNFLSELFDLARGYGKKVNQNEYLKGLLKNI